MGGNRNPKQKFNWQQAMVGIIILLIFAVGIYFTSGKQETAPANPIRPDQNVENQNDQSPEQNVKTNNEPVQNNKKDQPESRQKTHGMIDINMVSETTGWKFITSKSKENILKTTDGGNHWKTMKTISGANSALGSSFFVNAETGWIGYTPDMQSRQMNILSTRDGGKTWRQTAFEDKGRIKQIQFLDPQNGWVLASLGIAMGHEAVELFRTKDGGQYWTKVAVGMPQKPAVTIPFSGDKTGFRFINETTGWLTGGDASGKPYLFITRDGGETWEQDTLPVPESIKSAWTTTLPPVFFTENDGVLPMRTRTDNNTSMLFYVTHNRGETWKISGRIKQKSGSHRLICDFLDQDHWYAADGNHIYFSMDQGKHWTHTKLGAPVIEASTDLDFVSPKTGWLVYKHTSLFKTTDGGQTWKRQ